MPGYTHCTTEESAVRQRQFENALLDLMGQKELTQIAVKEICDRVGLSRKSFYRYFSSKEACLSALIDHAILDFTEMSYHKEQMHHTLEQFFLYWQEHRPLLDALCRNGLGNFLYERAMLCASQEYGIRDYFLQDNSSYEQTVFFISGLFGVLLTWYSENCQKSPAQLASSLSGLLPPYSHGVF